MQALSTEECILEGKLEVKKLFEFVGNKAEHFCLVRRTCNMELARLNFLNYDIVSFLLKI